MPRVPVLAAVIAAACALAAPAAAVADVVTVTTHSTGFVDPNPIVLSTLGLPDPGGPIAFDLTLSSTFDPATPGLIDSGNNVYAASSNDSVRFQLGSQLYQYSGNSWSNVQVYNVGPNGEGYEQQVGFNPPTSTSNSITFTQWVAGPAALIGVAQPLVPRDIGPDANLQGHIDVAAYPLNPDAPGAWHMTVDAATFTVSIVSAVPEPASAAMLGAGLLALAAWRRRTKR